MLKKNKLLSTGAYAISDSGTWKVMRPEGTPNSSCDIANTRLVDCISPNKCVTKVHGNVKSKFSCINGATSSDYAHLKPEEGDDFLCYRDEKDKPYTIDITPNGEYNCVQHSSPSSPSPGPPGIKPYYNYCSKSTPLPSGAHLCRYGTGGQCNHHMIYGPKGQTLGDNGLWCDDCGPVSIANNVTVHSGGPVCWNYLCDTIHIDGDYIDYKKNSNPCRNFLTDIQERVPSSDPIYADHTWVQGAAIDYPTLTMSDNDGNLNLEGCKTRCVSLVDGNGKQTVASCEWRPWNPGDGPNDPGRCGYSLMKGPTWGIKSKGDIPQDHYAFNMSSKWQQDKKLTTEHAKEISTTSAINTREDCGTACFKTLGAEHCMWSDNDNKCYYGESGARLESTTGSGSWYHKIHQPSPSPSPAP